MHDLYYGTDLSVFVLCIVVYVSIWVIEIHDGVYCCALSNIQRKEKVNIMMPDDLSLFICANL